MNVDLTAIDLAFSGPWRDQACLGQTVPWWKCIVTLDIWTGTVVSRKDNLTLNFQKKKKIPVFNVRKWKNGHIKRDSERLGPRLFSSRVKAPFCNPFPTET